MTQTVAKNYVRPQECSRATDVRLPKTLVYAVGTIGFDFGTEARRDALFAANGGTPILTRSMMAEFLTRQPTDAGSIIWTLSNDQFQTPIYAIQPMLPFGAEAYTLLTQFLASEPGRRVSVPGWTHRTIRLMNGDIVPIIEPDVSGLQQWADPPIEILEAVPVGDNEVNLTMPSALAWAYWGRRDGGTFDQSAPAAASIQNLTTKQPDQSELSSYTYYWSNGAIEPFARAKNAAKLTALNDKFQFTAPADIGRRTLTVYVSATDCIGTLTASLPGHAPVEMATTDFGRFKFEIGYSGSPNTKLDIEWKMTSALPGSSPALGLEAAVLKNDERNFMNRIYYELRNKGLTPQERATNFAITEAYDLTKCLRRGLNLQSITVAKSPLCRPESDCWDVTVTLFDPARLMTKPRTTYHVTVDVSDVKPVFVVPMLEFNEY